MTVIEQRHGVTKGDVREHWKEEVSKAFSFCALMFLAIILFAVPALILRNWPLVCLCGVILLAETAGAARMFYAIYKYGKVGV